MSRRRKRGDLSDEDRILWSQVARSVDPMFNNAWPPHPAERKAEPQQKHGAASLTSPQSLPAYQAPKQQSKKPSGPGAIDRPTRKKLAKGRVAVDATIDLHDLDQSEAHGMLLAFLHRAHASGLRHVLVITGKGSSLGSAGILRRAVPQWLATPPFRGLVSGIENAARHHGGDGAIYVRLARRGDMT